MGLLYLKSGFHAVLHLPAVWLVKVTSLEVEMGEGRAEPLKPPALWVFPEGFAWYTIELAEMSSLSALSPRT